MSYVLGYIDLEQRTLQPLDNPFGPRLSPMSQGRTFGNLERAKGFEPSTPTLASVKLLGRNSALGCVRMPSMTSPDGFFP
jgi:hypothetical protein